MQKKRIWEIDLLRGIAIILMVVFHFVYDLNIFAGVNINYSTGFWYWVGRMAAILFIFISGISSGFSSDNLKRGIKVFSFGMVVSVATYMVFQQEYVRFGILHFLGFCMIIFPLLKKLHVLVLMSMAIVISYLADPVKNILVDTSLLLPLGFRYRGFRSVDYYPLIPYLSLFILGVIAYKMYYYKRKSAFNFTLENKNINLISKYSLLIYVIHQPVIIGLILLFNYVLG